MHFLINEYFPLQLTVNKKNALKSFINYEQ